MLKVFSDGSCWPNPGGPCRYGFVVKREGKTILKGNKKIGEGRGYSNNVAEFAGLVAAMEALIAAGLNDEPVIFCSDSKLLVNLMNRVWHPRKGDYEKYFLRANVLRFKFMSKSFRWIPREKNTEADALSTKKKDEPFDQSTEGLF